MFYHYGIHEAKYHLGKTHLLISTADVIEESFSLVKMQSKINTYCYKGGAAVATRAWRPSACARYR